MRQLFAFASLLALAACGQQAELKPLAGASMPPATCDAPAPGLSLSSTRTRRPRRTSS